MPSEDWKEGGKHWKSSMANPEHNKRMADRKRQLRAELEERKRLAPKDIEGYAKHEAVAAIDFLTSVFKDEDARVDHRLRAANALLDRAIGKPKGNASLNIKSNFPDSRKRLPPPTTQELEALVQALPKPEEKVIN